MEARENEVREQFENAERTNQLADEKLADYEDKIKNYQSEGREIIKAARDEAKTQAQTIVDEANEKARQLMERSEAEIARERINARKELRDEVGTLAIMAAEQIMEKELKDSTHSEIIDKIIKEAEDKPWN